jgi:ribulose-phosphate 3-epimerase
VLKKGKTYIAPSILSADFSRLGEEIGNVERCGADLIHIDVMDGHFVPNITIGPLVVKSLRKSTTLPLDVHLMIENPDLYIEEFIRSGSDIITVHEEASRHLNRTIQKIRESSRRYDRTKTGRVFENVLCGVSINPHTPLYSLEEIVKEIDLILIMTVNPGFGGQEFITTMYDKIRRAKKLINRTNVLIEVDGGVNGENASRILKCGADILVSGNYIFNSVDRDKAIKSLRGK